MLTAHETAPDFSLESDTGPVSLAMLRGKKVVLYFYPKDSTPGCTREAQAFTALAAEFAAANTVVLGISRDSVKSHCNFKAKYGLAVTLVSDPDRTAHDAFGAFGEKLMYGRKVEGTIRSTFVIDEAGTITRVFPKVSVDGHAEAVLAFVRGDAAPTVAPATSQAKTRAKAPENAVAHEGEPGATPRKTAKAKSTK